MRTKALFSLATALVMVATCLAAFSATANALNHSQRNVWDQYRWPWLYGQSFTITQGQNGPVSHFDYHPVSGLYVGLGKAVDFAATPHSAVAAARDGVAHCENQDGNAMGYIVKIVHSPDSDSYAHADDCYMGWGVYASVAQGRQVSLTGTRAYQGAYVGDHVHFQRNSQATGGSGTAQIAVAFTMEGLSSMEHSVENGNTATSDNLSPGYSTAFDWEPAIHDTYLGSGGWAIVGSTASLPYWSPGRSTAWGGCPGSATPGWYDCNVTGVGGVPRYGRVQTFKGVGSGSGEHAIFKRSSPSAPATFMTRAFLGGFTDDWEAGRDGLYFLGYPTGNSYYWTGTLYRMDFENGYATFNTNGSNESKFYLSGGTLKFSAYYAD